MYVLKQSTAITVQVFAHDADGDGVTGIADGSWTKRISKNGGAFGAMTVTITEMENGWYSLPLGTGHTDTLGFLAVSLSATGAKRVNLQFLISAKLVTDLNDLSAAQVNDQVVDALNTDTYAEPGQGAPPEPATLAQKIGYVYKFLRNKITQTEDTLRVFNDAGDTVDQKATTSDDGTTYERGKIGTGP